MIGASSSPEPGWLVLLSGQDADLVQWHESLKPPFDPACERIIRDGNVVWGLRSRGFANMDSAFAVASVALGLIERLNGALWVAAKTEPVGMHSVSELMTKAAGVSHSLPSPE